MSAKQIDRTWLEIDGAALRHNVAAIARRVGPKVGLLAMVKANAYGHGMIPVARELLHSGHATALGVSDLSELQAVREAEITAPVLLCSAALPKEFHGIVALRGWPTLSTYKEAAELDAVACKMGTVAEAHFKVDTGMGRLGLPPQAAAAALQRILRLQHVRIRAVTTHCASADTDAAFTQKQIATFHAWRAAFPALPWHLANSAALFRERDAFSGALYVRPGLALYGLPPRPADRAKLRPVMTWKTRITLLRNAPRGQTVSYGATYRLPRPQTLATLAIGYGDGYPRLLSNRAEVLVRGLRCPIRGRVTMDEIVVDVSRVSNPRVGEEVILLGTQGKQTITADELARHAETISYEIVTGTSALESRLPRVYHGFKTA